MPSANSAPLTENRLLAALPPQELAQLQPQFQVVNYALHDDIFLPGDAVERVYFPLSGMVSLVALLADGSALETGIVGQEGIIPIDGFLDVSGTARLRCHALVQGPGDLAQLPIEVLRQQAHDGSHLRTLLERYALAALDQTRQAAVCNAFHPVEARLARWLLLAQDRTAGDTLTLTQEFLGLMLGVRRASVTTAEDALERAGLIRNPYGRIEVLNRTGLEGVACECYSIMRESGEAVFLAFDH